MAHFGQPDDFRRDELIRIVLRYDNKVVYQ